MTTQATGMNATPAEMQEEGVRPAKRIATVKYASALIVCIAVTAVAAPLSRDLDLANVVMLYPLTVLLVALRLGRGPAVLAAFVSVALFDFFLVPPYYTFAVADVQYLLTFAVMLIVALVTGHLTAGVRQQAEDAAKREQRARALYEMARALAGVHTLADIEQTVSALVVGIVDARTVMLLCDEHGKLAPVGDGDHRLPLDMAMAQLACGNAGFTDIDTRQPVRYQPMKTPARTHGVLAFIAGHEQAAPLAEHAELLEAVASLAAISVERVRYAQAATHEAAQPLVGRLQRAYVSLLSQELEGAAGAIESLQKAVRAAETEALLPDTWSHVSADIEKSLAPLRSAGRHVRNGDTGSP